MTDNNVIILSYIAEKLGVAIDWNDPNLLTYLREFGKRIILRELLTSVILIVIAVLCASISICMYQKRRERSEVMKSKGVYNCEDELVASLYLTVMIVLFILSVFTILAQFSEIMDCITIPETVIYKFYELNK